MSEPHYTMDAGDVLDPTRMNREVTIFWNQEDWIECNKELPAPEFRKPRRIERLLRCKPHVIEVRIAPPEDRTLAKFGEAVSRRVGMPLIADENPEDKAIWLVLTGHYRNAPAAVGATGRWIQKTLDGLMVGSFQIRARKDDQ